MQMLVPEEMPLEQVQDEMLVEQVPEMQEVLEEMPAVQEEMLAELEEMPVELEAHKTKAEPEPVMHKIRIKTARRKTNPQKQLSTTRQQLPQT